MEIHCSHIDCETIESVSTADLQPLYPTSVDEVSDLIDADGAAPASNGGFPYSIEDTIACIEEQLPLWEVYLEDDEHGGQTLKTICSNHFKKENFTKLIAGYLDGAKEVEEISLPRENNLIHYLIEVGAHLRTLAQESENSTHYTIDLANRANALLSRLDTTS